MEFCGGGSMADLVHASGDTPLTEDAIAYLCAETLAGLRYLHAIGKARAPCQAARPPASCLLLNLILSLRLAAGGSF